MNLKSLLALCALVVLLSPLAHAQWGAITTNSPQICLREEGGWLNTRACDASVNHFQAVYNAGLNAFTIRTGSGGCLDATAGSGSPQSGQPVRSVVCNGRASQNWWLNATGQIQNQANRDLCMDVEGGLGRDRRVVVFHCDFNGNLAARRANQRFYFGSQARPRWGNEGVLNVAAFANTGHVVPQRIGQQTVGVIAAGGNNVIAAGGNNVIAPGGGNVIAAGGNN